MADIDKHMAQRLHFKKRMKQRYGIEVNKAMYNAFIKAIQTNSRVEFEYKGHRLCIAAFFEKKTSNRASVFRIRFGGYEGQIPVVYDKIRKELVTALPELKVEN